MLRRDWEVAWRIGTLQEGVLTFKAMRYVSEILLQQDFISNNKMIQNNLDVLPVVKMLN